MRITQEADYAIRICSILDRADKITGASELAEKACITQRIALKVLRQLVEHGIVRSYKGACGGYVLERSGDKLRISDLIEAVDGPIQISKCLNCDHECSRNPDKCVCKMHMAFVAINESLINNLGSITVRMLSDEGLSAEGICGLIK
ncbi:MAG: Rrf2 family transcriptional regulator [Ruminococcaceae bacterium]|nr:Rrf2 family transcriptional regulator [Oscillospiraceae bacterium]